MHNPNPHPHRPPLRAASSDRVPNYLRRLIDSNSPSLCDLNALSLQINSILDELEQDKSNEIRWLICQTIAHHFNAALQSAENNSMPPRRITTDRAATWAELADRISEANFGKKVREALSPVAPFIDADLSKQCAMQQPAINGAIEAIIATTKQFIEAHTQTADKGRAA